MASDNQPVSIGSASVPTRMRRRTAACQVASAVMPGWNMVVRSPCV